MILLKGNNTSNLIPPYGGRLVNLVTPPEAVEEMKEYANTLASVQIAERFTDDLELLATGAFSPLDRFNSRG